MGKYDVLMDEFEPGSNGQVLKNHLGITDPVEMDMLETAALVRAQSSFLARLQHDHKFTVRDLCSMHNEWLPDMYGFAGSFRVVDVGKDGFQFASVQFLKSNLDNFERNELAKHTLCKSRNVEDCAESLAVVHGEFIMLHPFREGNGRLGRWLADAMSSQAGFPNPRFGFTKGDGNGSRQRYLQAVKKAVLLDTAELKQFFCDALYRALQEPF